MKKNYMNIFMKTIEDFNSLYKDDLNIDIFRIYDAKDCMSYQERASFNSIISQLSKDEVYEIETFLSISKTYNGVKYSIECLFNAFNESRKDISEDFEILFEDAVNNKNEQFIKDIINERCSAAHVTAHLDSIDYIVMMSKNSGLLEKLKEECYE